MAHFQRNRVASSRHSGSIVEALDILKTNVATSVSLEEVEAAYVAPGAKGVDDDVRRSLEESNEDLHGYAVDE